MPETKDIVLWVDNDPTIRIIGKRAVEGTCNCRVVLAVNGFEAVRMAKAERPKVIVLDYIMPGMDGGATLKKLREEGVQAPVIFLTALDDTGDLGKLESLGVEGILQKPFNIENLVDKIKCFLPIDNL